MAQNTAPVQTPTTTTGPSIVAPLPTPASRSPELNALLGKGSQFEGKLIFEGTVRIDGKFSGEIISTDQLIIGEGAEVKANVKVGTMTCLGDYQGDATASKAIELKAPAKVRGNLTTASVVIDLLLRAMSTLIVPCPELSPSSATPTVGSPGLARRA